MTFNDRRLSDDLEITFRLHPCILRFSFLDALRQPAASLSARRSGDKRRNG